VIGPEYNGDLEDFAGVDCHQANHNEDETDGKTPLVTRLHSANSHCRRTVEVTGVTNAAAVNVFLNKNQNITISVIRKICRLLSKNTQAFSGHTNVIIYMNYLFKATRI